VVVGIGSGQEGRPFCDCEEGVRRRRRRRRRRRKV
jgi:hypothetical protein